MPPGFSSPNVWLGILAGLGNALAQARGRNQQDAMAAAELMKGQGSWEPQPSQQNFLQRLLNISPQGSLNLGQQSFGFQPFPQIGEEGARTLGLTEPATVPVTTATGFGRAPADLSQFAASPGGSPLAMAPQAAPPIPATQLTQIERVIPGAAQTVLDPRLRLEMIRQHAQLQKLAAIEAGKTARQNRELALAEAFQRSLAQTQDGTGALAPAEQPLIEQPGIVPSPGTQTPGTPQSVQPGTTDTLTLTPAQIAIGNKYLAGGISDASLGVLLARTNMSVGVVGDLVEQLKEAKARGMRSMEDTGVSPRPPETLAPPPTAQSTPEEATAYRAQNAQKTPQAAPGAGGVRPGDPLLRAVANLPAEVQRGIEATYGAYRRDDISFAELPARLASAGVPSQQAPILAQHLSARRLQEIDQQIRQLEQRQKIDANRPAPTKMMLDMKKDSLAATRDRLKDLRSQRDKIVTALQSEQKDTKKPGLMGAETRATHEAAADVAKERQGDALNRARAAMRGEIPAGQMEGKQPYQYAQDELIKAGLKNKADWPDDVASAIARETELDKIIPAKEMGGYIDPQTLRPFRNDLKATRRQLETQGAIHVEPDERKSIEAAQQLIEYTGQIDTLLGRVTGPGGALERIENVSRASQAWTTRVARAKNDPDMRALMQLLADWKGKQAVAIEGLRGRPAFAMLQEAFNQAPSLEKITFMGLMTGGAMGESPDKPETIRTMMRSTNTLVHGMVRNILYGESPTATSGAGTTQGATPDTETLLKNFQTYRQNGQITTRAQGIAILKKHGIATTSPAAQQALEGLK